MSQSGRPPLEPRITALDSRMEVSAALIQALDARVAALEQRIADMNLAFQRGYLPANG